MLFTDHIDSVLLQGNITHLSPDAWFASMGDCVILIVPVTWFFDTLDKHSSCNYCYVRCVSDRGLLWPRQTSPFNIRHNNGPALRLPRLSLLVQLYYLQAAKISSLCKLLFCLNTCQAYVHGSNVTAHL